MIISKFSNNTPDPGKSPHNCLAGSGTGRPREDASPEPRHLNRYEQFNARILILEDDDIVTTSLRHMLKRLGCECVFTIEGEKTLKAYRDAADAGKPFDAVILDLIVPGKMGGQEVMAELRRLYPGIKSIVSSGYSDNPVLADHKQYGFDGVLPKPYMITDLADTLHKLLSPKA